MTKLKAFGYVRVSGKGQVGGDGFTRQEETIHAYCQKHGVELVDVYREEGVSGTNGEADRPAFQEMVQAILKNGVRTVIVEGLDRLAREYRVQETLLIYLASKDITLISARTEEDVTASVKEDPMKKALVQIQGVFAELEKSLLVKKLRSARERTRQEKGRCEGRKRIEETHPDLMQEIKRLRRKNPKTGKRRSYRVVAETLNQIGWTTPSGKAFTESNLQSLFHRRS